ncbi:MAG TPA: adenylosuccinate lyase [Haliscomenobacter sp.]|uniref:adenylosuccinate lyase n=1 Tax=Haliscomenobacter sp. TaxID=2717303 RepID=UPI002B96D5F9|nr:adenylosuccinate lyase [Haliscomenobacter sp.]HPH19619.1 adenylosuccinate lyase [Haliscomenobacter sp.]
MLTAISPIDGRYADKTAALSNYFSEYALIRYRVLVEVQYFIALVRHPLPQLAGFPEEKITELIRISNQMSLEDAQRIKDIERITNHDVKAVEYFLKEKFDQMGLQRFKEFIHFGLTSQDINNTAIPLSLRHALEQVYYPALEKLQQELAALAESWAHIAMLARTHGQPASPTRLGKEFQVFVARITQQLELLQTVPHSAKFGGATGNFNAHFVAYPQVDWHQFAWDFLHEDLGLQRSEPTTQIEHYDNLAAQCQGLMRINTILIDLCRDIWTYISMEYFKQKVVAGEIGSSAMPHKVNPIDFENAEGNLGMANAVFAHLAEKLPISRLQRDLTDSTVLRNLGVPFAHTLIAFQSIRKGLSKLLLNEAQLRQDLEDNWMVVAEAIQTILRREAYPEPYEALKALTRGKTKVTAEDMQAFIEGLDVAEAIKVELRGITPWGYTGG